MMMMRISWAAALAVTAGSVLADEVPVPLFKTLDGLEVTLWAKSPMLRNPTNMDIDKDGRIWVAEGVNYRSHYDRQPEGDRIVILEDTDHDGVADKSSVFVQEPFLRAPLGIAVLGNKVVVSMTPDLVVYTDVDGDRVFDPVKGDTREVVMTGFNGRKHDHSLHSVTAGPDGRWYWSAGNCGAVFTDKSGKTFRVGSAYDPYYGRGTPGDLGWNPREIAGTKSDDGHVHIGGFAARMNPDGSKVEIIGENFRNSYEQVVNSFGEVFQNDNDDPPACRNTFLLTYGNAGFCSRDGQRDWRADKRPGQSTPVAQWRQDDPGTMPAGDVYGGGSPTGVAFYENGALGEALEKLGGPLAAQYGMYLSCDAGRNVVFGYFPVPDGAGYKLERFNFLTTNQEGEFAGSDFKGGKPSGEVKTLFRPSDVCVGPDGAVYVTDWYDPRVGGHADLDGTLSGAVYRIAPKGFKSEPPVLDLATTEGQIEALKSPAANVRNLGLTGIKEQGPKLTPQLLKWQSTETNEFFRARAIWAVASLGQQAQGHMMTFSRRADIPEGVRLAAYRALAMLSRDVPPSASALGLVRVQREPAKVPARLRREIILGYRDEPASDGTINQLALFAMAYDGVDRTMLDAIGIGATGKEAQLYDKLLQLTRAGDPVKWPVQLGQIAWRLHPWQATGALKERALSKELSEKSRKQAVTALGFIKTKWAAESVLEIAAKSEGALKAEAVWWLLNRKDTDWKDFGVAEELKKQGIYDPDTVKLVEVKVADAPVPNYPPMADLLALKGDAATGEAVAAKCLMCHQIHGKGAEFGPNLDQFGKSQTTEVVLRSVIEPSAEISHGYDGERLVTTDGLTIEGIVISSGDPVIVQSMGGQIQMVPKARVKEKKPLGKSLMMSATQLGLTAQDLADLAAYLKK